MKKVIRGSEIPIFYALRGGGREVAYALSIGAKVNDLG